jgi:Protein of unknown function (DUF2637)
VRRLTAGAVLTVAAIAAVVSFLHIERLAATYGQPPLAAWLLPVSVDGTVAAASLAMLWAARTSLSTPVLARAMLALGVLATLAANAAYGAPHGVVGELVSGWPAVAFVGSVEMILSMVRRDRTMPGAPGMDGKAAEAVRLYAGDLAAGRIPGQRKIRAELHVGQHKARELQDQLRARLSAA